MLGPHCIGIHANVNSNGDIKPNIIGLFRYKLYYNKKIGPMIVTYEEDICRIDSYHPIVNGMKHLQQQRKCLLIFFHFILM